jgi:hypothetical protein
LKKIQFFQNRAGGFEMTSSSSREIRFLRGYALASSLVTTCLVLSAFSRTEGPASFDEINVKRINIVEDDAVFEW